jgi:hypothetical protein
MNAQDILLDKNRELIIQNGDFLVGPSDKQSIQSILNAFPGWWKQSSTVGVGMAQYLNSKGKEQEIQRNIRLQLEADGFSVDGIVIKSLKQDNVDIQVNAHRV